MSHKVTLKTKYKNRVALKRALDTLGIAYQEDRSVKFWSSRARGLAFQLAGWKYPVVVKDDGEVVFDNYNGVWGKVDRLADVTREYAMEVAKEQAWNMGWTVTTETLENGETVITLSDGGAW